MGRWILRITSWFLGTVCCGLLFLWAVSYVACDSISYWPAQSSSANCGMSIRSYSGTLFFMQWHADVRRSKPGTGPLYPAAVSAWQGKPVLTDSGNMSSSDFERYATYWYGMGHFPPPDGRIVRFLGFYFRDTGFIDSQDDRLDYRSRLVCWGVPHWLLVGLTGVAPMIRFRRWRRVRHRQRDGLCKCCGYDIRASPERCPECGMVITTQTHTPPSTAESQSSPSASSPA
jgi:hypothetical protein